MRSILATCIALAVWLALSALGVAQAPKAPEKLVFPAKTGQVTYLHKAHADREKGDCKVCHDKLFPQSKTAPRNFKAAMHKTAEANKSSCAACHVAGGTAFATKGNCNKCHEKKAA
jgi:c(7)-type cytochrome triheme protein